MSTSSSLARRHSKGPYRVGRGSIRTRILAGVSDLSRADDAPPPGPGPAFTEQALQVLRARYLLKGADGRPVEAPNELLWRVARALAAVEARWGGDVAERAEAFCRALARLDLLPNSPTLMNAGKERGQLSACFVLPLEDSLDAIFETIKSAARIHSTGGGTGFAFSRLRPRDDAVTGGGRAAGPVAFLRVFDAATAAVHQGGVRRGANMGILRVDHPDVLEFVDAKRDPRELTHFNISVAATDAFMAAVAEGRPYDLVNPRTGRPAGQLDARAVWDRLVDSAWATGDPGLVFVDRINAANPTPDAGAMESTNPCVVGETRLATQHGLVKIEDLYLSGSPLECTVDERALGGERAVTTRPAVPAFVTHDSAEVWKITTRDGYSITATPWHELYTARGKLAARDLEVGDEVLVQSDEGQFGQEGSYELGFVMGLIAGDGCFGERPGNQEAAIVSLWGDDRRFVPRVLEYVHGLVGPRHECHTVGSTVTESRDPERVRSVALAKVLDGFGFNRETKLHVPEVVWRGTPDCVRGYLQGLFQADGTVNVSGHAHAPTCSVRLASSTASHLEEAQLLLANFGVFAPIRKRRSAGRRLLPAGHGGLKSYHCRANYELIIGGQSRDRFMERIGFPDEGRRARRYAEWAEGKALKRRQAYRSRIESIEPAGRRRVFDTTQPDHHTVIFNGLVSGQCGELPLLPYESCNLGSVDVSKHLTPDRADVDWARLGETVRLGVRLLDDVIDVNAYPLGPIRDLTLRNRKIGLGVMGWADLLIELGIPYAAPEALALAERLMACVQAEARAESERLAEERGPFPGWPTSRWAAAGAKPRRNATVTTIAPTGTISLLAGCSSGIEPLYAVAYVRRALDGTAELPFLHPTLERIGRERGFWSEALAEKVLHRGTVAGLAEVPADVQALFQTAHEIPPEQHIRMQAAFQRHSENAVSKTINLPRSASAADVAAAYRLAYDLGCKGITVYRDGSREGQVLATRAARDASDEGPPLQVECGECVDPTAGLCPLPLPDGEA